MYACTMDSRISWQNAREWHHKKAACQASWVLSRIREHDFEWAQEPPGGGNEVSPGGGRIDRGRARKSQLAAEVGWHGKYLSVVLNGHKEPKGAEEKLKAALGRLVAGQERDAG